MDVAVSHRLVGRDRELAVLYAAIDASPDGDAVVLSGALGAGKTAMLGVAQRHGTQRGFRVVPISGAPEESSTPFAGVHQLLLALGDRPGADGLPMGSADVAGEVPRVAMRVLDLLSPRDQPVLVCVDDPHWLDRASREALLFAARRSTGSRFTTVIALPEGVGRDVLDRGRLIDIVLNPLDRAAAEDLLDRQPGAPSGVRREQVLWHAAGNPAALIDFCAGLAAVPAAGPGPDPLPLPADRVAQCSVLLDGLPPQTRRALLVLATASDEDLAAVPPDALVDPRALAPAEVSGLVHIEAGRVRPLHPLVRSAAYYRVPLAERLGAHRYLAERLGALPHRQAWHAAQAAHSDAPLADRLEELSGKVRSRVGHAPAALMMRRASELSTDREQQVSRLLRAAGHARLSGDMAWSAELSEQALRAAGGRRNLILAHTEKAWTASWGNSPRVTIDTLVRIAEMAVEEDPSLGWEPLRAAAITAFLSASPGAGDGLSRVSALLDDAQRDASAADRFDGAASRLWIASATNPLMAHADAEAIRTIAGHAAALPLVAAGTAAWLAQESETAVRCLRSVRAIGPNAGAPRGPAVVLMALAWACSDTGRWNDAVGLAAEMVDLAVISGQPLVGAVGDLVIATVTARRGDVATARRHVEAAARAVEQQDFVAIAAWTHHVQGLIALVEGRFAAAYAELGMLFDASGAPLHAYISYLGMPDWAAAALWCDDLAGAAPSLAKIVARLPSSRSPRIDQLVAHTSALLNIDEAGRLCAAALADPRGDTWPFERARLRMIHASWLRRQRRRRDSQHELSETLSTLERLGARLWIGICERELRASGVQPEHPERRHTQLSPQEHQIVYLAGQGMTNPQIGALLHLSARTVSGHLYRAFPKLGITNRRQIRDIEPPPGLPNRARSH